MPHFEDRFSESSCSTDSLRENSPHCGVWSEETLSGSESEPELAFVRYLYTMRCGGEVCAQDAFVEEAGACAHDDAYAADEQAAGACGADEQADGAAAGGAVESDAEHFAAKHAAAAEVGADSDTAGNDADVESEGEEQDVRRRRLVCELNRFFARLQGEDARRNRCVFACARLLASMLATLLLYVVMDALSVEVAAIVMFCVAYLVLSRVVRSCVVLGCAAVLVVPYLCFRATRSDDFIDLEAAFIEVMCVVMLHLLRGMLYVIAALALLNILIADAIP